MKEIIHYFRTEGVKKMKENSGRKNQELKHNLNDGYFLKTLHREAFRPM